jgi:hypothetical protein
MPKTIWDGDPECGEGEREKRIDGDNIKTSSGIITYISTLKPNMFTHQ